MGANLLTVKMRYNCGMKTKPLTFLLALTFLFSVFILTSCASHPDTKITYFKNGKQVECHKNNCKLRQDILSCYVFSETGTPPPNYTTSPSDTSSKVTSHSGTITDQSGSMYSFSGTSRRQPNLSASKGMEDMSNALGNLAKMVRHERQVENRFYECMNIMMGYDLVRKSNQPIKEPEQVTDPYVYEKGKPSESLCTVSPYWEGCPPPTYDGPTIDLTDMDKYK